MLRDKILIHGVSPGEVWPFIADPEAMRRWNPKLTGVSRGRKGPVQRGERYDVRYAMHGTETDVVATIEECQPESRLVISHRQADSPRGMCAIESYNLVGEGDGTLIQQCIDLSRAGIPLWARLLIGIIHCFGHSVEKSPLENLKTLIEENEVLR